MTHLTNLKKDTINDIQTMLNSGYTTGDLRTYYERASRFANDMLSRIDKAWQLTIIDKQNGLALFSAHTLNFILNNTSNFASELEMLDNIGAYSIANANHAKLVASSLAVRADAIWAQLNVWNQFQAGMLKKRPYAEKLIKLQTSPVVGTTSTAEAQFEVTASTS